MERTPFTSLLDTLTGRDGRYDAHVPEDWLQGRTVYGGLSAALSLEAAYGLLGEKPALRSVQTAFIGPAVGEIHLKADILRKGRSVTFVNVDLSGEKGLAVRTVFCFGQARASRLGPIDGCGCDTPLPDALPDFIPEPFLQHAPNFIRHYDMKLAKGGRPASGYDKADMRVWVRHHDEDARHGMTGLIALADALPPAIVTTLDQMVPISSMTWQMDFSGRPVETKDGWWLLGATAEAAGHGYSSQAMHIWSYNGELMLSGRQAIAIFA